jgi:hypothetical protein
VQTDAVVGPNDSGELAVQPIEARFAQLKEAGVGRLNYLPS